MIKRPFQRDHVPDKLIAAQTLAEYNAERKKALSSPDTAIAWHLDTIADEENYWGDTFHDLNKHIGATWYVTYAGTLAFLQAYAANPNQALARLADNPEHFGRLAHPMSKDDITNLVEYIKDSREPPTIQHCARIYTDIETSKSALTTLANAHPELYTRISAEHDAEKAAAVENFRNFFEQATATPTPNVKQKRQRRARER